MNALRRHRKLQAIWASDPGWKGWTSSVNHSDLGRMFLFTAFFFFLVGGVLAMLIRAQLATPDSAFVDAGAFAQFFTMHGTIMMFLFAIPAFEGLAIYLLPKMLGTRDLAFPRLTAYGYWCYAFGGALLLVAMLFGIAPNGGWFMYPPLTGPLYSPGINTDVWLIGITFVEISAICAAVEFTVSILKYRAPGMSLDKMPIFAWYALVTSLMILTGFPPLILGSVLLEVERAFGLPFFQADLGGDSLLWQHLFWLFGHPEVYIIFLPAAGVISTVIPVMARTTLLGYGWIVASIMALAFLSFGLWVHHMFTTGIPLMGLAFFSAASTLVAVPTGVQIFAWIGTMWKGRPELHMPMLHILGFFVTFVIGGLTGVMVAVVPFDWQAHDTAFITAHLHYVLFGGFVFPMLAGIYYWLPLVSGRKRLFRLGELAFALIFLGFHSTFLAMHWVGLLGQRRRIETYDAESGWGTINFISSVSSFVMAIGLALVLVDIIIHAFVAERSRRNPWQAGTLEWAGMSPPASYNFASLPEVSDRTPLYETPDLANRLAMGDGYLGAPKAARRETLMVDAASGRPEALVIYPGNTRLPILMAAMTGGFFLSILLKLFWLTPLALGECCGAGVGLGLAIGRAGRSGATRGGARRATAAGERRRQIAGLVGLDLPTGGQCHLLRLPALWLCFPLDGRAGLAACPMVCSLLGRTWPRHRCSAHRRHSPAPERPPQPRGCRPYDRPRSGAAGNSGHGCGFRPDAVPPAAPGRPCLCRDPADPRRLRAGPCPARHADAKLFDPASPAWLHLTPASSGIRSGGALD